MFGATLQELYERTGKLIPVVVEQCIEEVERRGMTEVGIYRLSGSSTAIQELRHQYNISKFQNKLFKKVNKI